MSASQLYPKTYKGKEESGGYITVNATRKSENSPHYRGRLYLEGVGWYWLSGWVRNGRDGELISIMATPLTDAEAKQYCAEKTTRKAPRREEPTEPVQENLPTDDSDIPF